jgi:hypothetical protein
MSQNRMRITIPSLLLAAALTPGLLQAQESDVPLAVQHRNNCRLAAQVMLTGDPAPKRAWADSYFPACGVYETPALLALWDRAGGDEAAINQLVHVSGTLRDQRLFDALTALASDADRAPASRVGALAVLARYVRPSAAHNLATLRLPADSAARLRATVIASTPHAHQDVGDVPLASAAVDRVPTLLSSLEASPTEDAWVRYAARVLLGNVTAGQP